LGKEKAMCWGQGRTREAELIYCGEKFSHPLESANLYFKEARTLFGEPNRAYKDRKKDEVHDQKQKG